MLLVIQRTNYINVTSLHSRDLKSKVCSLVNVRK